MNYCSVKFIVIRFGAYIADGVDDGDSGFDVAHDYDAELNMMMMNEISRKPAHTVSELASMMMN